MLKIFGLLFIAFNLCAFQPGNTGVHANLGLLARESLARTSHNFSRIYGKCAQIYGNCFPICNKLAPMYGDLSSKFAFLWENIVYCSSSDSLKKTLFDLDEKWKELQSLPDSSDKEIQLSSLDAVYKYLYKKQSSRVLSGAAINLFWVKKYLEAREDFKYDSLDKRFLSTLVFAGSYFLSSKIRNCVSVSPRIILPVLTLDFLWISRKDLPVSAVNLYYKQKINRYKAAFENSGCSDQQKLLQYVGSLMSALASKKVYKEYKNDIKKLMNEFEYFDIMLKDPDLFYNWSKKMPDNVIKACPVAFRFKIKKNMEHATIKMTLNKRGIPDDCIEGCIKPCLYL